MSLWTLVQASILFLNAITILNNDRFLEKYGWGFSQLSGGNTLGNGPSAFKLQIIGGIHWCSYLRFPLIVVNSLVVIVKLVFG
eukprot:jgi/Botrbrau1/19900/Bobra.0059s0021.1